MQENKKLHLHFRDGVEVFGGAVGLNPKETRPLLLQVPPGYNPGDSYRLRIEGYHRFNSIKKYLDFDLLSRYGGATIFNNETNLYFSNKFLSITISTNQVVFTAVHTMRVHVIILCFKFLMRSFSSDKSCNVKD